MNFNVKNDKRRIVPRWRKFCLVAATGELSSFQPQNSQTEVLKSGLEKVRKEWEVNNSIITASELLNAALVCGSENDLLESANYILSNRKNVRKSVVEYAESALSQRGLSDRNDNRSLGSSLVLLPNNVIKEIHFAKQKLRDWPRHATLWADLSRLYAIMGEDDKAIRAMDISLHLDGYNRFILRSAARLNVHLNDPEKALFILKNSGKTKTDPWILSADVAVNTIIDRSSSNIKLGMKFIKNNKSDPYHISELASAIGTVELKNGVYKKAKKYFNDSLLNPNDNALAQAEWASQKIKGLDTSKRLTVPKSFEAKTRNAFAKNDWENALQCCYDWVWDEPFSSIPAAAGSFIAESIFQDHEQAIELCKHGLRSNSNDNQLLNNLVVSLACSGKISESKDNFKKIKDIDDNSSFFVTTTATQGLIHYKDGNLSKGRECYDQAIETADRINRKDLKAIAAVYALREEKFVRGQKTKEYLKRAEKFVQIANDLKVDAIARSVSIKLG